MKNIKVSSIYTAEEEKRNKKNALDKILENKEVKIALERLSTK